MHAIRTNRRGAQSTERQSRHLAGISVIAQLHLVPYSITCARFARVFSRDMEGHAPSWPHWLVGRPSTKTQRTRPQRVPPCGSSASLQYGHFGAAV